MKKLRVISRASFRRNSDTQFITYFKMPNKKWGVARAKGSDPEQFFVFLINTRGSPFMRTSDFLSEKDLRSDLANRGISEAEIEALIAHAPILSSAQAQPK
jgi:hypothetical protein